ncbi:MAG TPA: alpha/beta fold hydrolase [Streptosporangiaceae bacterium]|nr:alpha/beta fold hydrolase [Streptosporangiaceae bacterium]
MPRLLAERFTVLCLDLRGCGQSSKPSTTPDHAPCSKDAMSRRTSAAVSEVS